MSTRRMIFDNYNKKKKKNNSRAPVGKTRYPDTIGGRLCRFAKEHRCPWKTCSTHFPVHRTADGLVGSPWWRQVLAEWPFRLYRMQNLIRISQNANTQNKLFQPTNELIVQLSLSSQKNWPIRSLCGQIAEQHLPAQRPESIAIGNAYYEREL